MIQKTIASDAVFGGRPEPAGLKVLGFTAFKRNTLRGFVDVELQDGMQIFGCMLHVSKSGGSWVGLPGKPTFNSEGGHAVGPEGKKLYTPVMSFRDRKIAAAFSQEVVAAVLERHPDALDAESES
jgi:hypothetical protein